MSVDERVQALEEEYKLIRGEVHRTLGNVRDFLLSLKVPNPPEKQDPPEMHKENHQPEASVIDPVGEEMSPMPDMGDVTDEPEFPFPPEPPSPSSGMDFPAASSFPEPSASPHSDVPQVAPFPEDGLMGPDMQQPFAPDFMQGPLDEPPVWNADGQPQGSPKNQAPDKTPEPDELLPDIEEETSPVADNMPACTETCDRTSTLDVNLLSNLIWWTNNAIREVGMEQLGELLDLYAATGNLSPQLKEFILHIAETRVIQPPSTGEADFHKQILEQLSTFLDIHNVSGNMNEGLVDKILHFVELLLVQFDAPPTDNYPETWSRLMLELHGILTRETVASQLIKPFTEEVSEPDDTETEDGTEEETEEENNEVSPQKEARLKLVLTGSNGTEEEFSLDFSSISSKQAGPGVETHGR